MKSHFLFFNILFWSCIFVARSQTPTRLLCNLLSRPEQSVITDNRLSFGWEAPFGKQTAYRILISSTAGKAAQHEGDVWDSGEVKSSQSVNVPYKGQSLQSGRSYLWQVSVRDAAGNRSDWSAAQQFNIGEPFRQRSWPGESRWVKIPSSGFGVSGGAKPVNSEHETDSIWTFENRHPISYHTVTPVNWAKRLNGTFFYDFGRAAFSNARFTIRSPVSNDITIRIGEKAVGDSIDGKPGGGVIFQEYPLALKQGVHDYELAIPRFVPRYPHSQAMPAHMSEIIPFRYLEIAAGDIFITVHDMEQRALYYLFDDNAASFSSSDNTLNAIYNLCKYSVKANTFNGDYSASQRERMMYEADCYIHQLGTYAIDREYAIARYSLENMIYHATWPTEWILHIPLMAWADYLNTGDISLITKYYDDLKPKTLTALAGDSTLISTRTGLLTQAVFDQIHFGGKKMRDIVDWPQGSMSKVRKGGETDDYDFRTYNTVVNAFHYRALVLMSRMAEASGKTNDAKFYGRRAKEVEKAFNKYFFDETSGIYVDGIGSAHSSLHANMFALAFGLVPDARKAKVTDFIKSKGMACGVYGANYLLEALYDAGEADYALSLLTSDSDRSWVNMIRVGATMTTEAWDTKYKSNNGWSHAWSSSPVHIIPRKLMGIEPLEPGFGKIRIKPQPASLKQASTKLPTIRGTVNVSFEQEPGRFFEMDVTIPGNTVAEIWVPLPAAEYKLTVDGKPVKGKVDGKFVKVMMNKNHERIRIER